VRHGTGIRGTASGASCAASLVKRGPVPSAHDPWHGARPPLRCPPVAVLHHHTICNIPSIYYPISIYI
jgi:hypothetical protein